MFHTRLDPLRAFVSSYPMDRILRVSERWGCPVNRILSDTTSDFTDQPRWRRENGENGNPISEHFHGSWLGQAMNLMDRLCTSVDEWVLSGHGAVMIAWWTVCWGCCSSLTLRFSWTVTLVILGFGVLRAHLLGLCCTPAFPPIFLQLHKRPLWNCAELLQRYALCSSDQCRTVKLRLPTVRKLFWGMLGRGDGGWRVICVSGSGYNEVFALEVRNVVWLRRTKETCKASCVYNGSLCVRFCTVVQLFVRAFICTFCMYVCMCAEMYVCIYMYMCMYMYMYGFIHMCMCMCMHICA